MGQVLLIAAVFLSAVVGKGWSGTLAVVAYTVGASLVTLGLLLLVRAAIQLGTSLTPFPAPRTGQRVVMTGAFALVRHPMYGGGILIAVGWTIIFASVLGLGLTLVLAIFLGLKARREEVWLSERLDGYEAYSRKTRRRLLPFIH